MLETVMIVGLFENMMVGGHDVGGLPSCGIKFKTINRDNILPPT